MQLTRQMVIASMLAIAILIAYMSPTPTRAGDNGNGTFTNPVLYADYSDPDIVRVGDDYYMVVSTFSMVPGLEILHSKDLINWGIVGYAAKSIDADPKYSMVGGNEYAGGVWAPSFRYYKGTYYILDNIQPNGTVLYRATSPFGPWTMNKLNTYLFDPSLVFDDDGTPVIYHGVGGHISVAVLDAGLTRVVSSTPAFTVPAGEGSHAYKINGTYYVFNSVYGQYPIVICSKSTNRTGPFTTVTVCDNHVPWSSPHQGGIVQMANGSWYGYSMADAGPVGRDVWMGPITWKDGWPYFGDPSAPTIPVTSPKPVPGTFPIRNLSTSDEFNAPALGLQWQWNHNPDNSKWSLTDRPGYLRLYTQTAANYSNARNTLCLRPVGPTCTGTIKIDTSNLKPGDRAGLSLLEQSFGYIAVYKDANGQRIVRVVNKNGDLNAPSEDVTDTVSTVTVTALWLQIHCDFKTGQATFSYSTDGESFTPLGGNFPMHFTLATFLGDRFGIFNYNPAGSAGWLDVDCFHYGE